MTLCVYHDKSMSGDSSNSTCQSNYVSNIPEFGNTL